MTTKLLISKKTLYEFREVLTSWVLRQIEMEFDAADIPLSDVTPSVSGARRGLVEQYYASLDLTSWNDVRKILKVFENILDWLKGESANSFNGEWAAKRYEDLQKWLKKDGFFLDKDGVLISKSDSSHLPQLVTIAAEFDSHELNKQIERVKSSIENDPALAIGTAKEILETTCKTILTEHSISVDSNWDVPELVKQTRKILKLVPDSIPDAAKGADSIKRLLSNLGTVAQSVSELRNLYGSGHGRASKNRGLNARHARLAVGAATTLAVFLFETHSELMLKEKAA